MPHFVNSSNTYWIIPTHNNTVRFGRYFQKNFITRVETASHGWADWTKKEFDLVRSSEIFIRILSGTVRDPNFSPRYTGLGSTGLGVRDSDGSLKFGPIWDRRHHGPKKFFRVFGPLVWPKKHGLPENIRTGQITDLTSRKNCDPFEWKLPEIQYNC